MPLSADGFRDAMEQIFQKSTKAGGSSVTIRSGDLHRALGGYPGKSHHQMPVCCSVMYQLMEMGDEILQAPPKGNGATLEIAYTLPRPEPREVRPRLKQALPWRPEPQVFADLEDRVRRHPSYAGLDQVRDLATATPATAIAVARSIAEGVTKMVCTTHDLPTNGETFDEMCGMMKAHNLLDRRVLGYVNTIRSMGNKAMHGGATFREEDRMIIAAILREYLLAVAEKGMG